MVGPKQSADGIHRTMKSIIYVRLLLAISLVSSSALVALAGADFNRPRGIYAVDSAGGTIGTNGKRMRDGAIRTNSFVSGYMLRPRWSELETNQGQYDFTIIDFNIRKLAALGQKLSLGVRPVEPSYLTNAPGALIWYDADPSNLSFRPVPWDPFTLERFAVFMQALAGHEIDGVKFKDHPVLDLVNFGIPGAWIAIRHPPPSAGTALHQMTNYSRANWTNAILTYLRAQVTNFPNKFVQVGFWQIEDGGSPSLWQTIRAQLMAEFNTGGAPRLGFWMENLAATRPAPGQDPYTGTPVVNFAQTLYLSQTNTWNGFQALTSWHAPFTGSPDITNATPADGIEYAYTNYGCTYFEIYASDISWPAYRAELEQWAARLTPVPRFEAVNADAATGNLLLRWRGGGPVYAVETATNVLGPFEPAARVTNRFEWTDPGATRSGGQKFYRLR